MEINETSVPKSLGIERVGYGEGFSVEEALAHWLATDPQLATTGTDGESSWFGEPALDKTKEVIHAIMREPFVPQRCKTEIVKQEGARKWETKHVIYDANDTEGVAMGSGATKQEAIHLAREIALDLGVSVKIVIEKHLVSGNAVEAILTPKTPRPGRWKFKASFLF